MQNTAHILNQKWFTMKYVENLTLLRIIRAQKTFASSFKRMRVGPNT
jgi:hypothetical protein